MTVENHLETFVFEMFTGNADCLTDYYSFIKSIIEM